MRDEDLLQCPLLQGLDAMHRAELIGLLNDSNLRQKLETCLAEHNKVADATTQPAAVRAGGPQPRNFEKEVHNWNPKNLIFSRSPKE
jgi:hypothetical protein